MADRPLGDSFEEAFRRIFGPGRKDVQHATTDIEVAVQTNEEARDVKVEPAPGSPAATSPAPGTS